MLVENAIPQGSLLIACFLLQGSTPNTPPPSRRLITPPPQPPPTFPATACLAMVIIDAFFAVTVHQMYQGYVKGGALPLSEAQTIDKWVGTESGGSGWDGVFDAERYIQPHLRSGLVEPEV